MVSIKPEGGFDVLFVSGEIVCFHPTPRLIGKRAKIKHSGMVGVIREVHPDGTVQIGRVEVRDGWELV